MKSRSSCTGLALMMWFEGTVYTITTRLERQNLVVVERKNSDLGPPRKFYRLNEAGQCRRKEFWDKWDFISARCEQLRKK